MGGWGALVAAGCVEASPYVLAQAFEGHYPHVWAACWYPWAFDAAIRLRRGRARSAPTLASSWRQPSSPATRRRGYYLVIALGSWAVFDGMKSPWLPAGRRREASTALGGVGWSP